LRVVVQTGQSNQGPVVPDAVGRDDLIDQILPVPNPVGTASDP